MAVIKATTEVVQIVENSQGNQCPRTTPDCNESIDPSNPLRTNGATRIPGEKAKIPKPIIMSHESPIV